ncbi:MAG: hypothetical protein PHS32_10000 [Rhodoferax sp.]|uniref:hypothetical protein n=1 Tax=Rhodoferax sp. TaxID=50421 RepID=UPI00261B6377|nr:hypothetical protein [Rhodoferax sp.]MDD5334069.1 hypothetical protein [Rhodoferax sp.]
MRHLLLFTLALLALCARADQSATEPPLSEKSKAQALQVLTEALADKAISRQQYDEALAWVRLSPCDGVNRSLSAARKLQLGQAIARQQKLKKVDIYQSFSEAGWSIIYVGTHVSDNGYFFYSGDPLAAAHPVNVWGGAAMVFETTEIAQWVSSNVKGIPARLAKCFAWHVTLNRDV